MEARARVRSLAEPFALIISEARDALRRPVGTPLTTSAYFAFAVVVGVANIAINILLSGVHEPTGLILMVGAAVLLCLVPWWPGPGILAYLGWWFFLLAMPGAFLTDMFFTNFGFLFLLRALLPHRPALSLALISLIPAGILAFFEESYLKAGFQFLVMTLMSLLFFTIGALVRSTEIARRREELIAKEKLEALRLEIAREMHDLVAYSMSQTALRAQRNAANPAFCKEARRQFTDLEATASDALHELRLLLRALRNAAPDEDQDVATATGLGMVVTDLSAAVRAVSEDVAAAGFDITYRCLGQAKVSRLQASTLSRVAREMAANIIRHGNQHRPVTMTLTLGPEVVRLVATNRIRPGGARLPRSGTGLLGMRERLEAVEGTLTTLSEDGSWIATASISLNNPRSTPANPPEVTA